MPPTRTVLRPIALASLVVLSAATGSVVLAGSASAGASNLRIVSDQPASGSGNLTVAVDASGTVDFKIEDASGTVSSTATVVDGGARDESSKSGVIRTTLNLSDLFASKPASGSAMVYAGENFSIEKQTFDTKREVTIDADAPEVSVSDGATVKQGETARIDYSVTDVPQKVRSATMRFVGPDGTTVEMTVDGLQAGTGRTAQVGIPSDMPPGVYNITLTAVDEAGHRTTDRLVDGLVVKDVSAPVSKLRIVTKQPIAGSGTITVKAATGEEATFAVKDAAGDISASKTVADGGSDDLASATGTIKTRLNLSVLYDEKPESGTAIVYANGGDSISIPDQDFDTKHQVTLDSDWPTANITHGGSAKQGDVAKVGYTVTDVPQKVSVLKLHLIGPDGLIYATVDGLQAGTTVTAEFTVPGYAPVGEYDVQLITEDEVGHRATDYKRDIVNVSKGDTSDTGETSNGVVASDIKVVSAEPVKGSNDLVVRVSVSDVGVNATFAMTDSTGAISDTVTVTDGGSADRASDHAAVIEASLNMSDLFDGTPASGTGIVYAEGGTTINVTNQTYQTKRQFDIDSDAPNASIVRETTTAAPGDQVKVGYSVTDTPPKVDAIRMQFVDSNGTVALELTELQTGTGRTAQFVVPSDMPAGEYDIKLVAVDEVGHRTAVTFEDGLVVENQTA